MLSGKNCVVMGVLNKWSVGWAIAEAMAQAGATVAISYLDERSKKDADAFLAAYPGSSAFQCDVESDESLDAFATGLTERFGRVDALVHSIAFAPGSAMKNRFLETTREEFRIALSVSAYSLIAATQRVAPLMTGGGSIMTMSFLAAERAFPRYNVMGVAKSALESIVRSLALDLGEQRVRVNAISAGPMKTAAARGIPGFADMYGDLLERAPIKDEFNTTKVGPLAVFLASDGASAITGETIYVDNGYHAVGM